MKKVLLIGSLLASGFVCQSAMAENFTPAEFLPSSSSYINVQNQNFNPATDPAYISIPTGGIANTSTPSDTYQLRYIPSNKNKRDWNQVLGMARIQGYSSTTNGTGYDQVKFKHLIQEYMQEIHAKNQAFPELDYAQMSSLTEAYNQGRSIYLKYNKN
jgi:hypothetical protein